MEHPGGLAVFQRRLLRKSLQLSRAACDDSPSQERRNPTKKPA